MARLVVAETKMSLGARATCPIVTAVDAEAKPDHCFATTPDRRTFVVADTLRSAYKIESAKPTTVTVVRALSAYVRAAPLSAEITNARLVAAET
jgi:hypothetical protein